MVHLVVVHEYTRFTWFSFLEPKNEVLKSFSKLCRKIHNEKGFMISKIRSCHGGDFENKLVENFSIWNGILHEFSIPRAPLENGFV